MVRKTDKTMKLYLLRPIKPNSGAWNPWYDKCFGMVVRAENEDAARRIADENAGDENYRGTNPWLDPNQSECSELLRKGDPGLIISDVHHA